MSRYRVTLKTGAWAYITVDAEDEESAIDEAHELAPELCAQCAGWGQDDVSLELGEPWEVDETIPPEEVDQ